MVDAQKYPVNGLGRKPKIYPQMRKITTSIIIPVHNGANFLARAIDSALAQKADGVEVIVVNDGSNDCGRTENIISGYGGKIRYFSKNNGGVGSALNLGLEKMRGRFFSWLSHDDIYLPDKIANQTRFAGSFRDSRNIFIFSAWRGVDANERALFDYHADEKLLDRSPFHAIFQHMINGCTTFISRELLEKAGGFSDLPTTQDYDMWFKLVRLVRPVYLDKVVLLSRLHPGQGFRTAAAKREARQTFTALLKMLADEEIRLSGENPRRFFSICGRSLCEIDFNEAYEYAWSRGGQWSRFLHRLSPKHNFKLLLNALGLLETFRKWRNPYLL